MKLTREGTGRNAQLEDAAAFGTRSRRGSRCSRARARRMPLPPGVHRRAACPPSSTLRAALLPRRGSRLQIQPTELGSAKLSAPMRSPRRSVTANGTYSRVEAATMRMWVVGCHSSSALSTPTGTRVASASARCTLLTAHSSRQQTASARCPQRGHHDSAPPRSREAYGLRRPALPPLPLALAARSAHGCSLPALLPSQRAKRGQPEVRETRGHRQIARQACRASATGRSRVRGSAQNSTAFVFTENHCK
jgi:hypothetical protein